LILQAVLYDTPNLRFNVSADMTVLAGIIRWTLEKQTISGSLVCSNIVFVVLMFNGDNDVQVNFS
jgi:hypothetical protein